MTIAGMSMLEGLGSPRAKWQGYWWSRSIWVIPDMTGSPWRVQEENGAGGVAP